MIGHPPRNADTGLVSSVADYCMVRMRSPDGRTFESPIAYAHRDPSLDELLRMFPPQGVDDGLTGRVVQARRAQMFTERDLRGAQVAPPLRESHARRHQHQEDEVGPPGAPPAFEFREVGAPKFQDGLGDGLVGVVAEHPAGDATEHRGNRRDDIHPD